MEDVYLQHIKERLKRWDKFPAHSEADFDCLVSEVVAALEDGFGSFELAAVIQNEFVNHFGEQGPDDEVISIADELSAWWLSQNIP